MIGKMVRVQDLLSVLLQVWQVYKVFTLDYEVCNKHKHCLNKTQIRVLQCSTCTRLRFVKFQVSHCNEFNHICHCILRNWIENVRKFVWHKCFWHNQHQNSSFIRKDLSPSNHCKCSCLCSVKIVRKIDIFGSHAHQKKTKFRCVLTRWGVYNWHAQYACMHCFWLYVFENIVKKAWDTYI